jgi:hypothetical protein
VTTLDAAPLREALTDLLADITEIDLTARAAAPMITGGGGASDPVLASYVKPADDEIPTRRDRMATLAPRVSPRHANGPHEAIDF